MDLSKTHIMNTNNHSWTMYVPPVLPSQLMGELDINTGLTHKQVLNTDLEPINKKHKNEEAATINLCKWCHLHPIVPSFVSKELCLNCSVLKNFIDIEESMQGLSYSK